LICKSKVKLQQDYIKTLEEDKQKKVEDVQKRILEANADISQLSSSVEAEREQELGYKSSISDASEKRNARQEMGSLLRKLSERIKTQEKSIEFYNDHDVCPTCSQYLDTAFKDTAKKSHTHKIEEIEGAVQTLSDQLQAVENRLEEIDAIEEKISQHKSNIITLNTKIIANQQYIQKLNAELDSESTERGNIDEEKAALKSIAKEVMEYAGQKNTLVEERHYLEIAGLLLKDTGIKTTIISSTCLSLIS